MSTATTGHSPAVVPPPDPFRYGWRYVKVRDKDGNEDYEQVPLTEEDLLNPEEGDFVVNTPLHDLIRAYLWEAARTYFADRPDVVVTSDCRVDWGSKYGWIHGPDWALFSGNKKPWGLHRATIKLKDHKAKVECVVEITSATTRHLDFGAKIERYFLVGVPYYVIVDTPETEKQGPIRLVGFKAGKDGYEEMAPDAGGRLPLGQMGLWLGTEGQSVFLEDAQGQRLPDFQSWKARAETAEATAKQEKKRADKAKKRAEEEKKRAEEEKKRAEEAERRAEAEHSARLEVERRLRMMEEELARIRREGKNE